MSRGLVNLLTDFLEIRDFWYFPARFLQVRAPSAHLLSFWSIIELVR